MQLACALGFTEATDDEDCAEEDDIDEPVALCDTTVGLLLTEVEVDIIEEERELLELLARREGRSLEDAPTWLG